MQVVGSPCDDIRVSTSTSSSQRSYQPRRNAPHLTAPGLIILQTLLIGLGLAAELLVRQKVAFFSGAVLLATFAGGVLFARPKIVRLAAVVPPLATFLALILLLPTIGSSSFSPTRLTLDVSASLANIAPYLIFGAIGAWGIAYYRKS